MSQHSGNVIAGRAQLFLSFFLLAIFTGVVYFEDGGICLTADIIAYSSNADDSGTDRCAARIKHVASSVPACAYRVLFRAMTQLYLFKDNGLPKCLIILFSPENRAPPSVSHHHPVTSIFF